MPTRCAAARTRPRSTSTPEPSVTIGQDGAYDLRWFTPLVAVQPSTRRGRLAVEVLGERVELRGSGVTFLAGEVHA